MKTLYGHSGTGEFDDAKTPVDEVFPLDDVTPIPDHTPGPLPVAEFERDATTPKHDARSLPGYELGRIQGRIEGRAGGYASGQVEGHAKGRVEGRISGIQEALDRFFAEAIRGGTPAASASYMAAQLAKALRVRWSPALPAVSSK